MARAEGMVAALVSHIKDLFTAAHRNESRRWVGRGVPVAAMALLLAGTAGLALNVKPPSRVLPIDVHSIQHWGGNAYAVSTARVARTGLAKHLLSPVTGDTNESPRASYLALLEQGAPIGAPHSIHVEIAEKGQGRFSHWGNELIFSSSDNSNPARNGRSYVLSYPVAPALWLALLLLGRARR